MRYITNQYSLERSELRFKCDSFAILVDTNTGDYFNIYKKNLGSAFEHTCKVVAPHTKYEVDGI